MPDTVENSTLTGTFGLTEFVKRQTKDSKYSYFDGSEEDLLALAKNAEKFVFDGEGVLKIYPEDPTGFFTSVVPVAPYDGQNYSARVESRREGEEPVITMYASGKGKAQAKLVELIFFPISKLHGEADASKGGEDWQLVSINASPTTEPTPVHPTTMARNQLNKEGGTPREYTPQEWAESVWFWSQHMMSFSNEPSDH